MRLQAGVLFASKHGLLVDPMRISA
jgi:hypothetical protein